MRSHPPIFIAIFIILLVAASCGKSETPTLPPTASPAVQDTMDKEASGWSSHRLLGYYIILADLEKVEAELIPVRQASEHWNVLSFLETGPCYDCVKISYFINAGEYYHVGISLQHPFPGTNFTGFDVRGIAMLNGSQFFPEAGLITGTAANSNDGYMGGADGYTTIYNPTTWGSGPGGLQGYFPGKFSTITLPSSNLNPFMRYTSPDSYPREAFFAGDLLTREYWMHLPFGSGTFALGYAVDASWAPPTTVPVTDPMTDFPPEANCPEPWKIQVSGASSGSDISPNGGKTFHRVEVTDHQGTDSFATPVYECPGLFEGEREAELIDDDGFESSWRITVPNELLAPAGIYTGLVSIEDSENAGSPDYLDLTAYQVFQVDVTHSGWVQTWGGTDTDQCLGIATDSTHLYVTGSYKSTVDFDPGDDVEEFSASGTSDAFLCRYDLDGTFDWVRVWGGEYWEAGEAVTIDAGSVYVAGYFNSTVDFDPGPGVAEYTSHGDWDSFLVKYDLEGEFQWARAWGADLWDKALDVTFDSGGSVYAVGFFRGVCDFDPGPGEDIREENPGASYLIKFDADGNYEWVRAWAGDGAYDDVAYAATGISAMICVLGEFDGTVDLDPGDGIESHTTPTLYQDIYLSRFDHTGEFLWGVTWGGDADDHGYAIECTDLYDIYATGDFMGTVDFDPSSNVVELTSVSDRDVFLCRFWSDGELDWVRGWGGGDGIGDGNDIGLGIAVNVSHNVYVTGYFNDTVDFDPGPGVYELSTVGGKDVFVNVIDGLGDFLWARSFGSTSDDYGFDVEVIPDKRYFVTGNFRDIVDFNPYPEEYNKTSNGDTDCFLMKYNHYGGW